MTSSKTNKNTNLKTESFQISFGNDFSLTAISQKPNITHASKEGWLDKQSNFWKTYRKRWIVLQGQQLYSFKEEKIYENPTEIFDLRIFKKIKPTKDGKTGQFELLSATDSKLFCASSENEMKDWIKHIRLSFNIGSKSKNNKPPSKKSGKRTPSNSRTATPTFAKSSSAKSSVKAKKTGSKKVGKKDGKVKEKDKKVSKVKNRHARTPSPPRIKRNSSNKSTNKKKKKKNGKRASKRNKAKQSGKEPRPHSSSLVTSRTKPKSMKINPSWMNKSMNDSSAVPAISKAQSQSAGTVMIKSESYDDCDDMTSSHSLSMLEHIKQNKTTDNAMYMYSVQFKSRPFGLTLNTYNTKLQIGAIIALDHKVSDQRKITEGSRLVSINGENCEKYKFKKIKQLCRTSTLPTIIKFTKSALPSASDLLASDTNTITKKRGFFSLRMRSERKSMINLNKNSSSSNIGRSPILNRERSPAICSTADNYDKIMANICLPPAAISTKSKSLIINNNIAEDLRDEKCAEDLMQKLNGIEFIIKAKEYEKDKDWYNCVQCYDSGIFELEKSLIPLTAANILNRNQQQYCQRVIDGYCRILNNLQRVHARAIAKHERLTESPKYVRLQSEKKVSNASRRLSHTRAKSSMPTHNNRASADTKITKIKLNTVNERFDDDHESQQPRNNKPSKKKRKSMVIVKKSNINHPKPSLTTINIRPKNHESVVTIKKREIARMKREMKTGKIEMPDEEDKKSESKQEPASISDIIFGEKNNKDGNDYRSKRSSSHDIRSKKKKNKNTKNKNTKKGKKAGGSKSKKNKKKKYDDDDDDEDADGGKKKKSKINKQDEEFRNRLTADIIDEKPDISFKDVQGLANVKLALYETIILPALRPELFTGLRTPTSGLLLFGPPGNGKTMIAKCVAAQCNATFFSISASSITSKFVGDAERIMRALFDLARERSPSIIFIDEIDSLLTARGGKNEAESSRRIKTEFLIQFDGVKKASDASKRVLVIGATNLPDQLDDAVLRRFSKRILVPLPDDDTRRGILRLLMSKQKTNLSDNDFERVVKLSGGYSCSDLTTLCKDAAMGPIRELGARILEINDESDMPAIEYCHFKDSLQNVRPSLPEESLKYFIAWNDKYGSKTMLQLTALPMDMRPYTEEELKEVEREREEKMAALVAKKEKEEADDESDDDDEYESS